MSRPPIPALSLPDLARRFSWPATPAARNPGWAAWDTEKDDALILRYIYQNHQPRRHLEFGTWQGFGTCLCLESCAATVWTINLPDGEAKADGTWAYGERASPTKRRPPPPARSPSIMAKMRPGRAPIIALMPGVISAGSTGKRAWGTASVRFTATAASGTPRPTRRDFSTAFSSTATTRPRWSSATRARPCRCCARAASCSGTTSAPTPTSSPVQRRCRASPPPSNPCGRNFRSSSPR